MQSINVRLRLVAVFALLLAVLVIVGWQGAIHLRQLNAQTQEIFSKHWQKSKISSEALRLSNLNNRITLLVFMPEDQNEIQRLLIQRAANTARITGLVSQLEVSLDEPEEKRLLAVIKTRRIPYVNTYERALTMLTTEGKSDEARRIMIQETLPLLIAYHDAWNNFYQHQSDEMATAMLKSKNDFVIGQRQFLLMVGVAGLVTVVIAWFTVWRTGREFAMRRQAEMAAIQLAAVVESSPDAIIGKNQNGVITTWNNGAEKIFGYAASEMIGTSIMRLIPADREHEESQILEKMRRGESMEQFETLRQNKDGRLIAVSVTVSPIKDATGSVIGISKVARDITQRKQAEVELEQMHKQLLETSRQAGRAEVATSVLHNVGNVLNSVNVASSCLADSLRKSKAANLSKVVTMFREHEEDLGTFLTNDPRGKQLPGYLAQLAEHLSTEQAAALKELAELQKNIEHIKDIVTMQQSFAKVSGAKETLSVVELIEDALRMNSGAPARHDVMVIKEFQKVPSITVEKHKVLQILVNLVNNAKQSCDESGLPGKRLTLRLTDGNGRVRITVTDNGIGIPSENLTRIFAHGFTTKQNGHGFGLHSGALAAKELGGSLNVQSDGHGQGATFTLELPCNAIKD